MAKAMAMGKRAAAAKANAVADWTVLVYLAGDNNLDGAGVVDLLEMKKVGSSDRVHVLAQFDRSGVKQTTKRYRLSQGTKLAADVLEDLGETNTGDPKVLREFLSWGVTTYPARHYLVVLWNHGSGWDDSNLYAAHGDYFSGDAPPIARKGVAIGAGGMVARAVAVTPAAAGKQRAIPLAQARAAVRRARRALFSTTVKSMVQSRAIAFDDQAKDFLDNIEMKGVVRDIQRLIGRRIDILGFDACLMSMLEVAYQVKGAAAFTVGSQEEEPNDGWPYDRVLKSLSANPAMSPAELSGAIVRHYLASYGANAGVTFSAIDLGRTDAVALAVDRLGTALSVALSDAPARKALSLVRGQVQEYSAPYDDYVDLVDLCDGLIKLMKRADVAVACKQVKAAVTAMVLDSGAKGAKVARSHGTSIYFPKRQVCKLYATLDFAKKSAWAKFINAYAASLAARGWD